MEEMSTSYKAFMADADDRVNSLPFMSTPVWNMYSTLAYLLIVTIVGPKYIKGRKPIQLRLPLFIYNMALVGLNGYFVYEFLAAGWWRNYSLECQEVDYSNSPSAIRMLNVTYLYWLSKHIEFLDTYFFILKQKWNNVSVLHVTHHSLMSYTTWWLVKFAPGGFATFGCLFNSAIHVVMYFYYGVSVLGPQYQKYLWWKKYLTTFQMVQFICVFIHLINILIRHPDCQYPRFLNMIQLSHCCLFFYLFFQFYQKSYQNRRSSEKLE